MAAGACSGSQAASRSQPNHVVLYEWRFCQLLRVSATTLPRATTQHLTAMCPNTSKSHDRRAIKSTWGSNQSSVFKPQKPNQTQEIAGEVQKLGPTFRPTAAPTPRNTRIQKWGASRVLEGQRQCDCGWDKLIGRGSEVSPQASSSPWCVWQVGSAWPSPVAALPVYGSYGRSLRG